jgi:malate permease and related proteins
VIRLAVAPALAAVLAAPFALGGVARAAGIVQSAMPAAVLVSIIATEHDIVPGFVTSAVFFSTVCSVVTLTVVLALV